MSAFNRQLSCPVELPTRGTTRYAGKSTCIYSWVRYSAMDKTITVDQLETTDLRSINEIWLGETHTQLCLWRGEQRGHPRPECPTLVLAVGQP
eukprot:gene7701-9474_t